MAFFKRKSPRKDDKKNDTVSKHDPKQPYTDTPTHATSNTAGQGDRVGSNQKSTQIVSGSRSSLQKSMSDSTLGDAQYLRSIAHESVHGTPTHTRAYPDQTQRSRSEKWSSANLDSADILHPNERSQLRFSSSSHSRRLHFGSDYFSQHLLQTRGFGASPSSVGRYEHTGKEIGFATPNHSSDSGYESGDTPSATGSRASSVQDQQQSCEQHISKGESHISVPAAKGEENGEGFKNPGLPCPRLPIDRMQQPTGIRSDHVENGDASPIDQNSDSRSAKSIESSAPVMRKARFEDDSEPIPSLRCSKKHGMASKVASEARQGETDAWPALPPVSHDCKAREHPRQSRDEEALWAPANAVDSGSPKVSATKSTKRCPSVAESLSQALLTVTALVSEQPNFPTLEKIASAASSPPSTMLDGLKVNKRGKVLDEEGDIIAELVQGDILDCVRQKVNARGEVQDEHGRVVGLVRTLGRPSINSAENVSVSGRGRTTSREYLELIPPESPHTKSLPTAKSELQSLVAPRSSSVLIHPALRMNAQQEAELSVAGLRSLNDQAHHASRLSTQEFEEPEQSPKVTRTASHRSLSDLSKSYVRPSMSAVPEDHVANSDNVSESSGMFAYKGELSVEDRAYLSGRFRSRSPSLKLTPKSILLNKHAGGAMLSQNLPDLCNQGGRMGSRHSTTPRMGSYSAQSRTSSVNSQLRRSPSSSQDLSLKRREAAIDPLSDYGQRVAAYNNAASVSIATASKPRTYFTHAGRVTVDSNAVTTAAPVKCQGPEPVKETQGKSKRKMSFGFGKKDKN